MISLTDDAQAVLYAGWHSDVPMWKLVDGITEMSNNYCYISDTPAGKLMGSEARKFQAKLPEVESILNFNDFVSQNLAQKYVGNDGNALIFVSDYNPESVLIRTELPELLKKDCVKTINGIPKEELVKYHEVLSILEGTDAANQKVVSVISGVAENYLADTQIVVLSDSQRLELENLYGKETVEKIVSDMNIIVDTSAWTEIDSPISQISSDIPLEETLKQFIEQNNQNKPVKNVEGLNAFIEFEESQIYARSSKGDLIYDVTKVPDGFSAREWYDFVAIDNKNIMSNAEIVNKYRYITECTQSDIDSFRTYEYFVSKGANSDNILSNGIMTDTQLWEKYSVILNQEDISILDDLRVYEYRVVHKTDSNINSKIYFDANGKIVGVDFSSKTSGTFVRPTTTVFETDVNDISKYVSDDSMLSKYVDFNQYSALEKLQAKQYEYERVQISNMIDNHIFNSKDINLLSMEELTKKYAFISDSTDMSVIKELQLAEYRDAKYGTLALDDVRLHFDGNGKLVGLTDISTQEIPHGAVLEITRSDYLEFPSDEFMQNKYTDFADCTILNGCITDQERVACQYLDEVGNTFDYPNFAVTGHSLGGNLALVSTIYTATEECESASARAPEKFQPIFLWRKIFP